MNPTLLLSVAAMMSMCNGPTGLDTRDARMNTRFGSPGYPGKMKHGSGGRRMAPPRRKWKKGQRTYRGHTRRYYNTTAKTVAKAKERSY